MPANAAETPIPPAGGAAAPVSDARAAAGRAAPSRRTRVFISYAQESPAHCARVKALADALAADRIAVELDQYHAHELLHWPTWCEAQVRPEGSDYVLLVCTAEYRHRVEDQVDRDEGRGVFWEGRLVYNALYRDKGNARFVPLLLDGAPEDAIPNPLYGWTHFRPRAFGRTSGDRDYLGLLELLTHRADGSETHAGRVEAAIGCTDPAGVPDPIRTDALAGIADALDLLPTLREALARRLTGDPAARAADLAERLCPPAEAAFLQAMQCLRRAVADAAGGVRGRAGGLDALHERAHDILGWMVVTTVMDGYRDEDAPAVRAWFEGRACRVPIGRSLSLEVLSARWLKRQARFGVGRGQRQTGEDDITPEHLGETGFDLPETIGQGEVVNAVWRLVYQKIDGRTAPPWIDPENRERLGRRLQIRLDEQRRRLRLVVDPADLRSTLGITAALRAIGEAIPWLHLMVIAPTEARPRLFLLPAGVLAGDIEECLGAIADLRKPSGQPPRPAP